MWQRQPVSLRRLLSLIFCLLWISLAPAFAQSGPDDALNAANADLDRVQASIEAMAQDDAALGNLRADTVRIQDATELIAQELTPQLTALDARLNELGPGPAPDAQPESPEVQQERADLSRQRGDIHARIKRARLLSVAAAQAGDQITANRRALFDEKLWQRTKSVLAPSFWRSEPEPAARRVASP